MHEIFITSVQRDNMPVTILTLCKLGTFANSEDQDEMQLNVAFHQGLHCL